MQVKFLVLINEKRKFLVSTAFNDEACRKRTYFERFLDTFRFLDTLAEPTTEEPK